jgi:hypothetical protein
MRKIGQFIGQVLVLAFAAAIIIYTTSLTFLLAAKIVPDNIMLQAMVCILFDGAAFVWFVLFITKSNSVLQWGISALSWILSMAGVAVMAGGELLMSQKLFNIDNPEKLGLILVVTVIAAAIYNAISVYVFHFVDQNVMNHIENSISVSTAKQKIYDTARSTIEGGQSQEVQNAGYRLAAGLVNQAAAEIHQQAAKHEHDAIRIIDSVARDAAPRQSAQPERVYALDDTQPVKIKANPTPPAKQPGKK